MQTYDCAPTMDDNAVLDFCRSGYLMLEGIVPGEVNDRVMAYCDEAGGGPGRAPTAEDWYVKNVTLNPALTGVVRSLLGRDFGYVQFAASHRMVGPYGPQRWHRDGGAVYGPQLDCLQVFYLPQETSVEMGPTEVLPGSHLLFQLNQYMAHYGRLRGSVLAAAPPGSVFVTHYGIWHRRSASTVPRVRNLLKFWYLRTGPPVRDWVVDPAFELDDAFHARRGRALGGRCTGRRTMSRSCSIGCPVVTTSSCRTCSSTICLSISRAGRRWSLVPEREGNGVQDLLYVQATSTSPASEVVGMTMFIGGEEIELPANPNDWPYRSILDAVKAGWRIVKFPELSLLLDEGRNYGLGCEFILERTTAMAPQGLA